MGSGEAYDVFLSYARSDEAAAAELNSWLRDQGLSTFFDRSELRPGLRWVPALEDAIGRSRAVAILIGEHGIGNTQQYEREIALIRQASHAAFPVIPVLMPGCDYPPTGFLQLLTWVDLSKERRVLQQRESLEALRVALRGETAAWAASAVRASICPYRGLEPFREEDAAFFCGRDDAVRELVARVDEYPFVAVVGPSGSGKSSLVFAGLIPALRKQGRSTMWDVVALRPGKSPLTALAEAFDVPPDDAGPIAIDMWLEREAAAYRAGEQGMLVRVVDRRLDSAQEKPDRLLIYVDQWEELYAMAPEPEDKERANQHSADVEKFVALLIAAASGPESRVSVVLTVRADFYSLLIGNSLISAFLPRNQVNISPMRLNDLRSAIETPAKYSGLSFSPPELVDWILHDVGSKEGGLPLLQFALKETWQLCEGHKLTAEAYVKVGGVAGALQKTAQYSYEMLSPAQQVAARRLFLRLVTPGEGQADSRARSLIPDDPQQRDIVNIFANPKIRLLVTGFERLPGPVGEGGGHLRGTVELVDESLIRRWPTLREWVDVNRSDMRARAAILRAKAEWEEHDQDEKFLLDPGVRLERARELLDNRGDVAVDDIRDYVNRSIKKDQLQFEAARAAARIEVEKELQRLVDGGSGRSSNLRYYVSYAWSDESDPKREERVDELCEEGKRRGIDILRDKTVLTHGALISEFMKKIGEGDRVFIFISEKYLKSPNCMFELFETWRNTKQRNDDFLHRVRFFMIDAKIEGWRDRLVYTNFWKKERDELEQEINSTGWQYVGKDTIVRFRHVQTYATEISDVLALFANVVRPQTFDDFLSYGFNEPLEIASND